MRSFDEYFFKKSIFSCLIFNCNKIVLMKQDSWDQIMRISFCQKKKKNYTNGISEGNPFSFSFCSFFKACFFQSLVSAVGKISDSTELLIQSLLSFYYLNNCLFFPLATYLWTVFQVSWEFSSTDSKAFAILLRNGISEGDLIISMTVVIYIAWLKWTLLTFILWEVLQL